MKKRNFINQLIFTAIAAITTITTSGANTPRISLNSTDGNAWQLCPAAETTANGTQISKAGFTMPDTSVAGVVPGVTFTAYVDAGLEENPEWSDNIYRVDESFYNRPFWYRTEFETPEHDATETVWLQFDSTHKFAEFYLNGRKIGVQSGHMARTRIDITIYLNKTGANALAVLITDPKQKKHRDSNEAYGDAASPSYMSAAGWDWMPYIPGRLSGITGNVWLEVTGDVSIENPWVRSNLSEDNSTAELSISTDLRNAIGSSVNTRIDGVIQPGNIRFSKEVSAKLMKSTPVTFTADEFPQLRISNPDLWWPAAMGEQKMYTCELTLTNSKGVVMHRKEVPFGIRRYDYKLEKNSENQPYYQFYVNGKRVYLRGGNWGISEYLLRCHGEEYEKKIRLHREMNFNMIRLWTGCVTDEEFYEYCDRYGIMVWDDFWLYVAYFGPDSYQDFENNAREKVLRLRNHPSIAVWCGANEMKPFSEYNTMLADIIATLDGNDRLYKPCSNDDGLSGSGWWSYFTPDWYFETASNALSYSGFPFTDTSGYGMRTEIGVAAIPTYESTIEFIPEDCQWPLPDDNTLENSDESIWNRHFFGKEAANAGPVGYKKAINNQYGSSANLEEFCERAQLLNLEAVKGMYEAWNDKMWDDASGLLLWMSNPAYPACVWQTYDWYYDFTGCYWGAKQACEDLHLQWNSRNGSVKIINQTPFEHQNLLAKVNTYDLNGNEKEHLLVKTTAPAADKKEIGNIRANNEPGMRLIFMQLCDDKGNEVSRNVYWHNSLNRYDYTPLRTLPEAEVTGEVKTLGGGRFNVKLTNRSSSVAFALRLRAINTATGERILPLIASENYVTLLPNDSHTITIELPKEAEKENITLLLKQYNHSEHPLTSFDGIDRNITPERNQGLHVTTSGGSITVTWPSCDMRHITVTSTSGVIISQGNATGSYTSVQLTPGMYIVSDGNQAVKAIIK